MDLTASTGMTAVISESRALCARRYKSGDCGTRIMLGHRSRASAIGMTFLTPRNLASREQANVRRRQTARRRPACRAERNAPVARRKQRSRRSRDRGVRFVLAAACHGLFRGKAILEQRRNIRVKQQRLRWPSSLPRLQNWLIICSTLMLTLCGDNALCADASPIATHGARSKSFTTSRRLISLRIFRRVTTSRRRNNHSLCAWRRTAAASLPN